MTASKEKPLLLFLGLGIFILGLFIGQHFSALSPKPLEQPVENHIDSFKKPRACKNATLLNPTLNTPPTLLNPNYPPHVVHQQLSRMQVGNYEFHYAKLNFLKIILDVIKTEIPSYKADLVVIVGFERGDEAYELLKSIPTLRVHGFEAQGLWMDVWEKRVQDNMGSNADFGARLRDQVTLTHAIVSETTSQDDVKFDIAAKTETAQAISMNSVIKDPILLMSVDIDGYELAALKGSKEVIENPALSPAIMLVEISYSVEDTKKEYSFGDMDEVETLKFLDERGYIMLGICWWGTNSATKLHQIHNCKALPADFRGYTAAVKEWMRSDSLQWTIANVIAIKRGLFTDDQLDTILKRYTDEIYADPQRYVRIQRIVDLEETLKNELLEDHWEQRDDLQKGIEEQKGNWRSTQEPTEKYKKNTTETHFLGGLRYRGKKGFERSGIVECTWCGWASSVGFKPNTYWCPKNYRKGLVKCP